MFIVHKLKTCVGVRFRTGKKFNMSSLSLFLKNISFTRLRLYCLIFILIYVILPFRYASKYEYIPEEEIRYHLLPARRLEVDSCPIMPDLDCVMRTVDLVTEYDELDFGKSLNVMPGGSWEPRFCKYVHDVALIIPYRGRVNQLKSFLHHIHPFLQRQLISYKIFVIEQTHVKDFNRGKLMNIGYVEAMKIHNFHCFIFHDVDLLPLVDMNIYGCTLKPRHLSASINSWRFKLKYSTAFGGVIAILQKHFFQINGFSNLYFGWGGEDDDLMGRILLNSLGYCRFSPEVSRYYMIHHKPEAKNPERMALLNRAQERYRTDGISSLKYKVLLSEGKPLYTHIVVDV